MPHCQRHTERELRQTADRKTTENPQSILRPDDEQKIARKKSGSARDQQKGPRSESASYAKEQGKDQIKLDQHGEIPPCRVEVHEVFLNIDEPQTEQAQNDAGIHWFETGYEWRNQIN